MSATSSLNAKWCAIPADDEENARLIVSRNIIATLQYENTIPKVHRRSTELIAIQKELAAWHLSVLTGYLWDLNGTNLFVGRGTNDWKGGCVVLQYCSRTMASRRLGFDISGFHAQYYDE